MSSGSNPSPPALVPLTIEDVKRAVPTHLRSAVTQSLVDTLNNISNDPLIAENIRDNFISYSSILKDGKFKTEDYLNAVTYVSFKLMGLSNQEAYIKTFPQRHAALVARGATPKDVGAYVAAYNKGKLVNQILEQTMVPTWVLNQDAFQRAINVQLDLMTDPNVSPKVRTDAANSLLNHLKKPDSVKGELKLDIKENNGIKEMREALEQLARQQREMIAAGGMKTVDIAASRLIDREGAEDVE